MNDLKMSREARKVFQALEAIGRQHDVQGEITPAQIYNCEKLLMQYNGAPIIQMIKTGSTRIRSFNECNVNFNYWHPTLIKMLHNNTSATKKDHVDITWLPKKEEVAIGSLSHIISNYLIADYGYDDMVMLQMIINTYNLQEISYACKVGIDNRVYEIRYINAVLEKERAKAELDRQRIIELGEKIESSKVNIAIVEPPSVMALATAQYEWKEKLENAELEYRMREVLDNVDKG